MIYVVVTKLGDEKDYKVFARNTDAILHCARASTKPSFFFLHDDPGCEIFRVNTNSQVKINDRVATVARNHQPMMF